MSSAGIHHAWAEPRREHRAGARAGRGAALALIVLALAAPAAAQAAGGQVAPDRAPAASAGGSSGPAPDPTPSPAARATPSHPSMSRQGSTAVTETVSHLTPPVTGAATALRVVTAGPAAGRPAARAGAATGRSPRRHGASGHRAPRSLHSRSGAAHALAGRGHESATVSPAATRLGLTAAPAAPARSGLLFLIGAAVLLALSMLGAAMLRLLWKLSGGWDGWRPA